MPVDADHDGLFERSELHDYDSVQIDGALKLAERY